MSQDQLAPKQLRSNSTVAKTRSDSDMSVSDLANLMKSQFASYQQSTKEELKRMSEYQKNTNEELKRMGDSLLVQMDKLRADISVDIEQLREKNNKTFNKLEDSIGRIKAHAESVVDHNKRINDLIVSGVPYLANEDLIGYFATWCQSLGYAENCLPLVDIRRLSKGTPKAGTASLLLIQFAITVQRNDFFARYLRSRNLALTGIGFSVNQRIFINENIGLPERQLRSKALAMKKNGKLSGVFTKDGIIYAKKNGSNCVVAVMSTSDLEDITQE